MKRIIPLFILVFALAFGAWAQTNPNRLIVVEKTGNYKGFLVERLDNMMFEKVEGRVAADVEFLDFISEEDGDIIKLAVTMTESCYGYKITVMPSNRVAFMPDEASLAAYIDANVQGMYYNDFQEAAMQGFDYRFEADADYTIVTLGYDRFGIACTPCTAEFHTPKAEIVGNPDVESEVIDVTADTFTIKFIPNDDVASYSMCSFKEGEAEQQFNFFGAWMGFSTIAEMVYAWGIPQTGEYTHIWTAMNPGTNYEVLIAIKDVNGNFAEVISVPVTTLSLGGEGTAAVTITIGDFDEMDGHYYQEVVFTPNSDTAVYHAMLIEKETCDNDWGVDRVKEYLMSDTNPYNPFDSYWDLYGEDDGLWNATPSTSYYAFAIGKNALGEWGELCQAEFTTPDVEESVETPAQIVAKRVNKGISKGTVKPIFTTRPMPTTTTGVTLK